MDFQPTWLPVFRDLGINIAILADFHSDSHPTDTGKLRLNEQKVYFDGCAALLRPRLPADSRRRAGRQFRRPLHVRVPDAGVLHAREAAGEGPGGAAVRGRSGARTARCITPARAADRVGPAEEGERAGVADASAHQGLDGLSGRSAREGLFPERPIPGRHRSNRCRSIYRRSGSAKRAASACWTT